jgi:hypothetical protein
MALTFSLDRSRPLKNSCAMRVTERRFTCKR